MTSRWTRCPACTGSPRGHSKPAAETKDGKLDGVKEIFRHNPSKEVFYANDSPNGDLGC